MDYDTLLYVWDAFSFILFVVVLLANIHEPKGLRKNFQLILASLLLFFGLFLFNREWYLLSEGRYIPMFTFFTYGFSAAGHMMIISLITFLYRKKGFTKKIYVLIIAYSLLVGAVMEIDAIFGGFTSKHIWIGIINFIPQAHLVYYIVTNDKKYYRNIFVLQVMILGLIYIMKTVNLVVNFDIISLANPTRLDQGLLMIANVVIYSYFLSYLLVKGLIINNELNYHKSLVESSLSKAIELSEIDSLTNVYNRRKIEEVFSNFDSFNQAQDILFSVVMIDINKFKRINDELGHQVGDEVLKFVASEISTSLRNFDIVSRWGGDEFLLILPNADLTNTEIVVDKIKKRFKDNPCISMNACVELSFGYSSSEEGLSNTDLIKLADERMYIDKNRIKKE